MNFVPVGTGHNPCLSACLQSILGLSPNDLPPFSGIDPPTGGDEWIREMNRWLFSRGLQALYIRIPTDEPPWQAVPSGLHIRCGPSAIDGTTEHAVVYLGSALLHDPTPPGGGILWTNAIIALVPLDPARVAVPPYVIG